jgi:hypothetical protein
MGLGVAKSTVFATIAPLAPDFHITTGFTPNVVVTYVISFQFVDRLASNSFNWHTDCLK